jgi:hypothetical protein
MGWTEDGDYVEDVIIHERTGDFRFEVSHDTVNDTYRVSLPHQCDNWDIADGAQHAEAAIALIQFIQEAAQAYQALMGTEEE